MQYTLKLLLIAFIIITVNILYIKWQLDRKRTKQYRAISGNYKGQAHEIKDWRKIAIELAKNTKNSRLNAMAKYGTDEDIIGLLYVNFGVELVDYENNK